MSSLSRLAQTSAVRIALRYVLLYGAILLAMLLALLAFSRLAVDPELEQELTRQAERILAERDAAGMQAMLALIGQLQAQVEADEPLLWLLQAADGASLAGNISRWPDDAELPPGLPVRLVWIDEEFLPAGVFEDDARLPAVARRLPDGELLYLARGVEQAPLLAELAEFLLEGTAVAVAFALLCAFSLGRAVQRRIDAISATAQEILSGDLSRRMPVSGRGDEFDRLSEQLNRMLERIELLVAGLRQVTDNIAHDLRGPLTRLRNRLDVALLETRSEAEYRQAMQQGIEDADELIRTFNALLSIAQAEAGAHRGRFEPIDLKALVEDLGELYAGPAEEAGQQLLAEAESCRVQGSRDLLAQAVGNLLENAVKYAGAGGPIRLRVARRNAQVEISVSDAGPGIPAAERERAVQRFVRLESSRSTPGNGLGLAMVRAVARLHQGELELTDADPGLCATIRLPLLPAAAQ